MSTPLTNAQVAIQALERRLKCSIYRFGWPYAPSASDNKSACSSVALWIRARSLQQTLLPHGTVEFDK